MGDVARKRVSYAEYMAIANERVVKYEYVAGEIVAMSGGTIAHGRSLREYVLVSQEERCVEVDRRDGRRWIVEDFFSTERFGLNIKIAVDDLYVDRVGVIVS
jgi:hypothetical protein